MKKLPTLSALCLLVGLGACTPDVPQVSPGVSIMAVFDPATSTVPTPNDLAVIPTGKIVVPAAATDSAAQTEFNTEYLGTLTGFPRESTAQASFTGAIDPSTVTPRNVLVLDLTDPTAAPSATVTVDTSTTAIDIAPPPAGWSRAHEYAVAIIGGSGGVQGTGGIPVYGSPAWGLVSSPNPLVTCPASGAGTPDFTSTDCRATVDVIPSTKTDTLARLVDQGQTAAQLEQIRELYAQPLAAVAAKRGVAVTDIPLLWTFKIVDAGEVTFDPAHAIIPFPNDVLRTGGLVNLPSPVTGQPLTMAACAAATDATTQLYCGLNTLDGFSTTVAPISAQGAPAGSVVEATIDPMSLVGSVGLQVLVSNAPAGEQTTQVGGSPAFVACLNCVGTATTPQQLQWELPAPLDEKTTYLAYVTTDMKDTTGKNVVANPVFALTRSKNPIAVGSKSQVNILTDAQATQLEPLRAAMQPVLDALEAAGLPRSKLALAWTFTTQSEGTLLDALYAYPRSPAIQQGLMLSQGPRFLADATALYTAAATAGSIPVGAIGKFYAGVIETPVAVTNPSGAFDLTQPQTEPVWFAMSVPAAPAPAAGYPVTLFGHGITRSRNDFLGIANALAAAGQVTIATDTVFHGERTSCTGFGAVATALTGIPLTDDIACFDATAQKCNGAFPIGRCVARSAAGQIPCPGPGAASPGSLDPTGMGCPAGAGACILSSMVCEGGDFARDATGRPTASGWNMFSLSNFFATRDNFRQQVIDLSQLVYTLRVTGANSIATLSGTTLDLTKIGYVGQSLGGILGTLFNAVSPDTTNVVLNVPGGDLTTIILDAPSFAAQKAALLAALLVQHITPGTPAFDQFIGTAQWIVDPADPANLGWRLTHTSGGAPNAQRAALIQFIEGDQTVPNISNLALVAGANRTDTGMPPSYGCMPPLNCYEFTEAGNGFDATSVPLAGRHGFLLAPPSTTTTPSPQAVALTVKAQTQAASFLATGTFTP